MFDGLASARFGAILADPPWHFRGKQGFVSNRDANRHYDLMSLSDICAMPVRDVAAPDAHLFLWVTGPALPQAFEVIPAWGFRYSGVAFTWAKLKKGVERVTSPEDFFTGLGMTTRKGTEICLLARRGGAKRAARDVRELILSPVRGHSRKPAETHDRIERYCEGPYLELFAREARAGWTAWGNEAPKAELKILS